VCDPLCANSAPTPDSSARGGVVRACCGKEKPTRNKRRQGFCSASLSAHHLHRREQPLVILPFAELWQKDILAQPSLRHLVEDRFGVLSHVDVEVSGVPDRSGSSLRWRVGRRPVSGAQFSKYFFRSSLLIARTFVCVPRGHCGVRLDQQIAPEPVGEPFDLRVCLGNPLRPEKNLPSSLIGKARPPRDARARYRMDVIADFLRVEEPLHLSDVDEHAQELGVDRPALP